MVFVHIVIELIFFVIEIIIQEVAKYVKFL